MRIHANRVGSSTASQTGGLDLIALLFEHAAMVAKGGSDFQLEFYDVVPNQ